MAGDTPPGGPPTTPDSSPPRDRSADLAKLVDEAMFALDRARGGTGAAGEGMSPTHYANVTRLCRMRRPHTAKAKAAQDEYDRSCHSRKGSEEYLSPAIHDRTFYTFRLMKERWINDFYTGQPVGTEAYEKAIRPRREGSPLRNAYKGTHLRPSVSKGVTAELNKAVPAAERSRSFSERLQVIYRALEGKGPDAEAARARIQLLFHAMAASMPDGQFNATNRTLNRTYRSIPGLPTEEGRLQTNAEITRNAFIEVVKVVLDNPEFATQIFGSGKVPTDVSRAISGIQRDRVHRRFASQFNWLATVYQCRRLVSGGARPACPASTIRIARRRTGVLSPHDPPPAGGGRRPSGDAKTKSGRLDH